MESRIVKRLNKTYKLPTKITQINYQSLYLPKISDFGMFNSKHFKVLYFQEKIKTSNFDFLLTMLNSNKSI